MGRSSVPAATFRRGARDGCLESEQLANALVVRAAVAQVLEGLAQGHVAAQRRQLTVEKDVRETLSQGARQSIRSPHRVGP